MGAGGSVEEGQPGSGHWAGGGVAGRGKVTLKELCATGCSSPSSRTPWRSWRKVGKLRRRGGGRPVLPGVGRRSRAKLWGPDEGEGSSPLEVEHDNMRVAGSGSFELGEDELGLRSGGASRWFWHGQGHYGEGRSSVRKRCRG